LPPSLNKSYKRYGDIHSPVDGDLSDCICNDVWGTKESIEALITVCDQWATSNTISVGEKNIPDLVSIGDISLWRGGEMPPHDTHQDGRGIDIRTGLAGAMVVEGGANNNNFNRDKSVELVNLVIQNGFTRIYTMCPYVTDKVNNSLESDVIVDPAIKGKLHVTQCAPHHHHFHIDYKKTLSRRNDGRIMTSTIMNHSYCNSCQHKPCTFTLKDYIEPPV
jgi:hypothetical protein